MAQSVVITDLLEDKHLSDSSVLNPTFIRPGWTAASSVFVCFPFLNRGQLVGNFYVRLTFKSLRGNEKVRKAKKTKNSFNSFFSHAKLLSIAIITPQQTKLKCKKHEMPY